VHAQYSKSVIDFDVIAWLARRYRLSGAHAKVVAELSGIARRSDSDFYHPPLRLPYRSERRW
jgi:hypothetical protein